MRAALLALWLVLPLAPVAAADPWVCVPEFTVCAGTRASSWAHRTEEGWCFVEDRHVQAWTWMLARSMSETCGDERTDCLCVRYVRYTESGEADAASPSSCGLMLGDPLRIAPVVRVDTVCHGGWTLDGLSPLLP